MTRAALLPCPFCGERQTSTIASDVDCYFVRCEDCLAEGPPEDTLDEAMVAWNARAEIATTPRR
ncbi:Lar family restriction alleviation protein [Phenylobacterium aquaticum]|uniref:Lar family restriction alleviation protein n=1 Tax=Phenylobacterium aquaticum TaxID=1763816 RepID=UPI003AFB77C3